MKLYNSACKHIHAKLIFSLHLTQLEHSLTKARTSFSNLLGILGNEGDEESLIVYFFHFAGKILKIDHHFFKEMWGSEVFFTIFFIRIN